MKLERINAAAQTELPNASPLSLSQRVSNTSAPIPDRKRIVEKIVTGALPPEFFVCACDNTRGSGASWDLFILAKTSGHLQNDGSRNPGHKRPCKNTCLCRVNWPRFIERKHSDKQRHRKTDPCQPGITEQRQPSEAARKLSESVFDRAKCCRGNAERFANDKAEENPNSNRCIFESALDPNACIGECEQRHYHER